MPDKSRRQRYSARSKRQGMAAQPAAAAQTPGAAPAQSASIAAAPAPSRVSPAHSSRGVAQMEKTSAVRFANVPKEIRTIGILAGVILIALIIIARVL